MEEKLLLDLPDSFYASTSQLAAPFPDAAALDRLAVPCCEFGEHPSISPPGSPHACGFFDARAVVRAHQHTRRPSHLFTPLPSPTGSPHHRPSLSLERISRDSSQEMQRLRTDLGLGTPPSPSEQEEEVTEPVCNHFRPSRLDVEKGALRRGTLLAADVSQASKGTEWEAFLEQDAPYDEYTRSILHSTTTTKTTTFETTTFGATAVNKAAEVAHRSHHQAPLPTQGSGGYPFRYFQWPQALDKNSPVYTSHLISSSHHHMGTQMAQKLLHITHL